MRHGLLATTVAVAMLAGCARPDAVAPIGGPGGAGAGDMPLDGSWSAYGEPCDDGAAQPESPLPPGAVLIRATRCIFGTQTIPGDGVWRVRADQEATIGLGDLAAALRLPSRTAPPGTVCAAIGYAPIVITLTDQTGRRLRPAIPHGVCGEPLAEVRDALAALTWTTTATTQVQQVQTELSVTSGCSQDWKPMIAIVAVDGGGSAIQSTVDTSAGSLTVCRYAVGDDPTQTLDMGHGVLLHGGKLTGASTLDPAAAQELLAAIRDAPRAAACDQVESPFAVLTADGKGWWLTVELGGCHRVLVDADNSLRQLDAALVDRLLA